MLERATIFDPGRVEPRRAGWEWRMANVLRHASVAPFDARYWNCARFAHTCAQAVSGREYPFVWKGSLADSADAVLQRYPDARLARRGDIVLASVPEPSLGVCLGAEAAFVSKRGMFTIALRRVSAAWSV